MSAARFYSNYPGSDLAVLAASFILSRVARSDLANAVVLLPTRRAATALREAFRTLAGDGTLLLPRMISLADVGDELLGLLGPEALPLLQATPPAMSPATRQYLLALQVMLYERTRFERDRAAGRHVSESSLRVEHALQLADYLADLQDRCVRAGIDLSYSSLRDLVQGDYAEHWKESVAFLDIVGSIWPEVEAEQGFTTAASHEVHLLQALRVAWEASPPAHPVFAVGSTASQPATAALLSTIARLEHGYVVLPGLDPRIEPTAWDAVHESHPYFHLKQLLAMNDVRPCDVQPLGVAPKHCSIWLDALCRVEAMGEWRTPGAHIAARFAHLRTIACQHAEEEARVIALLMREGLEKTEGRIALITPDESLMARVAAHLAHYGIAPNRLSQGSLAQTETGSLLVALLELIAAPESVRSLVQLLRHPLVMVGDASQWQGWLDLFEQESRGVSSHGIGQLPAVAASLRDTAAYRALQAFARRVGDLSRARQLPSEWVAHVRDLLQSLAPMAGQAHEKIAEVMDQCAAGDLLGSMEQQGFRALLAQALDTRWRGPQFDAHPQLIMLTPVEARLQSFDRVILGNMVDRLWPGLYGQSPWLNLAQQATLGLPGAAEHATLLAHDVLMHGSCGEVFLTYPLREAGSPVARSRFVERLLTLAEAQGIPAASLESASYRMLAEQRFQAVFAPEPPPYPRPLERPASLRVGLLDKALSDPFAIYAESILGLRALEGMDAEPEPRDLGTAVHEALEALSLHWNEFGEPSPAQLDGMAHHALRAFEGRPAVQLFWLRRLMLALRYVNTREMARRGKVEPEQRIEQALETKHGSLRLRGKIDRIEGEYLVDYKTGKPPEKTAIEQGQALQLLAYACMRAAQGHSVTGLEYWGMPSGKRDAQERGVPLELQAGLRDVLDQIMDPATAFLARPQSGNDRFENDYDGISRYDEWAG